MKLRSHWRRSFLFLVLGLLSPAAVSAQQQPGGIAGLVRDTSGAVLPGASVEASSPALIERVRSVVTDGEGRYGIVGLPPGTYVVTFSLSGFSTIRREGVQLTSGFTATINADMQVGSLQETITVSGASPLVDTQNVRRTVGGDESRHGDHVGRVLMSHHLLNSASWPSTASAKTK